MVKNDRRLLRAAVFCFKLHALNAEEIRAKEVINGHRDALENIAKVLLAKETIEKDEFAEIVGFVKVTK